jgi:hypothetical protein
MKYTIPNAQTPRDSAKAKGLTQVTRGLTQVSPGLRVQTRIKAGGCGSHCAD